MDEEKEEVQTDDIKRKTVICRSCSAEFDASVPNCPYCGTMNLPAAETAYMNKLEDIRGNLEGLGSLGKQETRAHLKRLSGKVLITSAVVVMLVIAVVAIRLHQEKKEAVQEQAEYLWQREGFAQMDEFYDAGAYKDLVAFYNQSANEGHRVWQYRHWTFCEYYDLLLAAQGSFQAWEVGDVSRLDLFYNEIRLYRLENMNDLSEAERALLDELRQPLMQDFAERFPLTEAELNELTEMLRKNGFVPIEVCERLFKERGWEE